MDENPRGTFLVRPSEHNPRGYSLSVKDWEEGRGHHVKHYKIKPLDNGGFFIATNQTFPTLPALVMAYSSKLETSFWNIVPHCITTISLEISINLFCKKLSNSCRERVGSMSRALETMPETAAGYVGSRTWATRQMGDQ